MAWLSTWYHSKPIPHHKAGRAERARPRVSLVDTTQHLVVQTPLLQIEELLELLHRHLGARHRVPDRPRVLVNLIVVPALECLVAEEVNRRVSYTSRLLGLVLEVLQAVGLVPAGGEDVEGDLAADGEAV